jgi:hypothetical protein
MISDFANGILNVTQKRSSESGKFKILRGSGVHKIAFRSHSFGERQYKTKIHSTMPANITEDNDRSRQGRIPATLQAVFLASNRGKDVNKPPPAKVASKVFFRNWLFQKQAGSKEKVDHLFGGIGKKKKVKKLKKRTKQESPKGRALNPKANVSAATSRRQKRWTLS